MNSHSGGVGKARCSGSKSDVGIQLPVLADGQSMPIKKSKNSKRRAAVLIGIHLLITVHVMHFLVAGKTLAPIEPSESMYTLELGQINAGVIFFSVALLSTLFFGRFVCGWGCHIVAYQDFCGWLMKKMGVKPKPFRSRLLVYVPLLLALYMFAWPTMKRALFAWPAFERLVARSPEFLQFIFGSRPHLFPGFSNHLMTTAIWKTFPSPIFAVLTILVCGFAAVYFLGAKGFCTYGCPYGGFFGLLDKASVGRILVTDACEQCGHCTATCTSNVRVHEEVKRYGMVVDPGCMKCRDCVSVCPNGALYFGFSKPSLLKSRSRSRPSPKRYDFTWAEELLLAAVFIGATLAFRGLYDGPPLLMSVGIGGLTAYVVLKLLRLLRDPTVEIQNLQLKTAGKVQTAGRIFTVVTVLWLVFTAHSGFVQWHRAWGHHYVNLTEAGQELFTGDTTGVAPYSPMHERAVAKGLRHLKLADRWGLWGVVDVKQGLAWLYLCRRKDDQAIEALRQAIETAPMYAPLYEQLTTLLVKKGRFSDVIEVMKKLFTLRPASAAEHFRLGDLLATHQRVDEAIEEFTACLKLAPDSVQAQYNLGGLLRRTGKFDQAVAHLRRAVQLAPLDVDSYIELALAHAGGGNMGKAVQWLRRAIQLAPDDPRPRRQLAQLLGDARQPPPG